MTLLSTLAIAATALAHADSAGAAPMRRFWGVDQDDFRENDEPLLGAPRDYRHDDFQKIATCPGSGSREHTMAQATVNFQNDCATVSAEIQARASGEGGWQDPHNRGTYEVLDANGNTLKIQRKSGTQDGRGGGRYTDVVTFALTANGAGCTAAACSESQGNSNNDAGTNMCNMGDLFCNSSTQNGNVACKAINTDLQYTLAMECGRYRGNGQYRQHDCQNFAQTCLRQESALALPELSTILGAPRDYRHDDFQKFATCPGAGAREHTMAQMTVNFQSSCADVSAELQARASGEKGWKDPHNRGTYAVLDSNGNTLKIQRKSGTQDGRGGGRYTDVVTFAMTANGAGCAVNACSESQGNSNNDAGTNMCNIGDLFCNSSTTNNGNGVACAPVDTDLQYTVAYAECGRYRGNGQYRQHDCQNFEGTCLQDASMWAMHEIKYL